MSKVLKALGGLFVCAIVGVFAMLAIAKHNLATARIPEDFRVTATSPGSSAELLEHDVAQKLEDALNRVKGVESIRSVVTSGVVVIDVHATAVGVDSPNPLNLAQQAIGAVLNELQIILDQQRLRALGTSANDVVSALQSSSDDLPAGRLNSNGMLLKLRTGARSSEAIGDVELLGGKAHVRDVATIQMSEEQGRCSTGLGVLVSVNTMPGAELRLPTHPAVRLTPFTPVRTATYSSAEGSSVQNAIRVLTQQHPGAVIAAESDLITLRFPEEPRLVNTPGLALRSVDDHHTVVRVSGPNLERLFELAEKLSAALAKENPRWLGSPWPHRGPEQVITPTPGVKGVAQALSLAIVGVETGRLTDGTPVIVRAGTSIEDAVLPDGRPVREVVQITVNSTPVAILRVNRVRAVELELGLEPGAVRCSAW